MLPHALFHALSGAAGNALSLGMALRLTRRQSWAVVTCQNVASASKSTTVCMLPSGAMILIQAMTSFAATRLSSAQAARGQRKPEPCVQSCVAYVLLELSAECSRGSYKMRGSYMMRDKLYVKMNAANAFVRWMFELSAARTRSHKLNVLARVDDNPPLRCAVALGRGTAKSTL